jgi:hypothetical protein
MPTKPSMSKRVMKWSRDAGLSRRMPSMSRTSIYRGPSWNAYRWDGRCGERKINGL